MQTTDMEKQNRRRDLMQNGSLPKVIFSMAVPSIIAFLINSVYSLADTWFVSSLGTNATAAVSVNASLDRLIMLAGSLLGVGASSYLSRLLGAREDRKANSVFSTVFFLALCFGGVIALAGLAATRPLVRLLGATPTCEQYAVDYATYVLLVAPLMAANFVTNHCLRAEGSAVLSMIGMGLGGVLNIALDPLFIFGLGLGVKGASMATAISKLVSFLVLTLPYLRQRTVVRLSLRLFRIDWADMHEIVSIGSSSLLRSLLAVVSAIVLNNIAGRISDSLLAAVGVSSRIMMFPFGVILGFGTGFQPVVGFNWGGSCYTRVRESYRFAARTALISGAVMGLLIALAAEPIIHAFAGTDPEMLCYGSRCIRLQCLALPIQGWVMVVNMLCAGMGDAKGAIVCAMARQGLCLLPLIWPMSVIFGAWGIVSVQALADFISLIIALPIKRERMLQLQLAQEGAT